MGLYRELVDMHRERGNLEALLDDEAFLLTVYETLRKWNMDQQGARLESFDIFMRSIKLWNDHLVKLYDYKLDEHIGEDISKLKAILEMVFCNLNVMESKRRIVGVSKTLHFLLPDLIMPIDGKYTLPAFYGYNKFSNSPKKEFATFWEIFKETLEITERLELNKNDVSGDGWNTSVPKLIDNAIIGLCLTILKEN